MRLLNELADNPILKKVRGCSERDDEQVHGSGKAAGHTQLLVGARRALLCPVHVTTYF